MKLFRDDTTTTFFEVLESVAGVGFTLTLGEVLEVTGDVPADLRVMATQGRVRALPDPGDLAPWLLLGKRVRPVSAETFAVRPEPPAAIYIDESEILQRFGWTSEERQRAETWLGFPPPAKKREKVIEGAGLRTVALLWDDEAIAQWRREVPAGLLASAGA